MMKHGGPCDFKPQHSIKDDLLQVKSRYLQESNEALKSNTLRTSVHVTALHGIVSVNSLFTVAVFIGFSFTTPESVATGHHLSCIASSDVVRRLIVLEVGSFSSFLLSSLVAQSLKLAINLINALDVNDPHKANINSKVFKYGLLLSAFGSFVGCALLTASMADFIQVKLGVFSCGGKSVLSLVTLVVGVGMALLVYLFTSVYSLCFI